MRKLTVCVLMAAVLIVAGAADASVAVNAVAKGKPTRDVNCEGAEGCTRALVAGQHLEVGVVNVEKVDGKLVVTYDTTNSYAITGSDWFITEIHFEVSDEPIENSAPGRFDYKPYLEGPTQYFQFELDEECDEYYYAAHAVVEKAVDYSIADLTLPGLPETVNFKLTSSTNAYIETEILGDSLLAGTYEGWCVDEDRTIFLGREYAAKIASSYEDLAYLYPGAVDNPDMLDEVNWIINQNFVGSTIPGCDNPVESFDVQLAIWLLLEGDGLQAGNLSALTCQAEKIAEAARIHGSGFEPACGDSIAVVLVPVDENHEQLNAQVTVITAQVTVISSDAECQPIFGGFDETAWACGDFIRPGKNWAMYFQCDACDGGLE